MPPFPTAYYHNGGKGVFRRCTPFNTRRGGLRLPCRRPSGRRGVTGMLLVICVGQTPDGRAETRPYEFAPCGAAIRHDHISYTRRRRPAENILHHPRAGIGVKPVQRSLSAKGAIGRVEPCNCLLRVADHLNRTGVNAREPYRPIRFRRGQKRGPAEPTGRSGSSEPDRPPFEQPAQNFPSAQNLSDCLGFHIAPATYAMPSGRKARNIAG
jgi:hypothetical protein